MTSAKNKEGLSNLMKKTKLNQIGKIGRANIEANKRLKNMYKEIGVNYCEIQLPGCQGYPLNYCHRHEREWYKGNVELLSSYNQTIIGCQGNCHRKIDQDKKLREEVFMQLRGKEII